MATADIDLTLYFRKKRTPPPSVLLLNLPNDKANNDQQLRASPSVELRSRVQKKHQMTPHIAGLYVNNSDFCDSSVSSYVWQRHTDKIAQITPAPDIAYRNTYLEEPKREKLSIINGDYRSCLSPSRSPSPRFQQLQQQQQQIPRLKTAVSSSSYNTINLSQRKFYQQYRTVYDYIRESIKQIERQRNVKQKNFSTRVKRPQNDDDVLRRVLSEKRRTGTSKTSLRSKNDRQNPQSLVNYMNHSREQIRILHTTPTNQAYQHPQIKQKYNRHRTNLSQEQNDSLDMQQSMLMTATVGNS